MSSNAKKIKKLIREQIQSMLIYNPYTMKPFVSNETIASYNKEHGVIEESPDALSYKNSRLEWDDTDAYAFGYYQNVFYIAGGCNHNELLSTATDNSNLSQFGDENPYHHGRKQMKYPGRIWKQRKIISFWKYPEDINVLKDIVRDIEHKLHIRIWDDHDYMIEVYSPKGTVPDHTTMAPADAYDYMDKYQDVNIHREHWKLLPLRSYVGSRPIPSDILAKTHLNTKKTGDDVPYGLGSRMNRISIPKTSDSIIKLKGLLPEAFSEAIRRKIKDIWKKENEHLTDAHMNYYIDMFQKYKDNSVFSNKDITQYKFKEIEHIIDANFEDTRSLKKYDNDFDKNNPESYKGDENVLYEDSGLLILLGDMKEKCIRYGKGQRWCVSRTDSANMFYGYRMRMDYPVFYIVLDKEMDNKNPNRALAVLVNQRHIYFVADANNNENSGSKEVDWDYIVDLQPKLKKLKHIFKPQPPTAEEIARYNKIKDALDLNNYVKLTYTEKEYYISYGHDLTRQQILASPKELVRKYAITGPGKNLDRDLLKKYLSPSDIEKLVENRKSFIIHSIEEFYNKPEEIDAESYYKLIYEPQDDIVFNGDLMIGENTGIELKSLPKGLVVHGNAYLMCYDIDRLPEGFVVDGELVISGTCIKSLWPLTHIHGALEVESCDYLTEFPEGFVVDGNLNMQWCKMKSLPQNMTIGGTLYADHASIVELPPGVVVDGSISLQGSHIKKLPRKLKVKGNLNVANTQMEKLPEFLVVDKCLNITKSKISTIPKGLHVWGEFRADGTPLHAYAEEHNIKHYYVGEPNRHPNVQESKMIKLTDMILHKL